MTSDSENRQTCEQRLDQALEESFPASDPPFFVGAGNQPGPKSPAKKQRGNFGQDVEKTTHVSSRR
jgi:hypothetical protein